MFRYFPRAPLATLVWLHRKEYVPSKSEYELILQSIKMNRVSDLSQEMDNLSFSENATDTLKVKVNS